MTTNKKWWIAGVSLAVLSVCAALSGSGIATAAYNTIQNAGSALTMRPILNFVNGGCADNPTHNRTDCAVSGGSGSGGGITVFSGSSVTLLGTQYLAIGGGAAVSSTETDVEIEAPVAAQVSNLSVQISAALGLATSAVFTWRDGASDQVLTCTISGAMATSCQDNTHSFNAAQGDEIDISVVTTGTPSAVTVVIATQFGSLANLNPTFTISNAASTGTTVNTLTKLTGAPSTAVITATTDTGGAIGITTAGAGTTGTATITTAGKIPCVFDGATTAGDYVQISSSTAGNCHDTGAATYPSSGQVLGRVLSTNASGGTYTLDLFPSEIESSSSGGGSSFYPSSGFTSATFSTSLNQSSTTADFTPSGSLTAFDTATGTDYVPSWLKTAPSTPWTETVQMSQTFVAGGGGGTFQCAGLVARLSSGSVLIFFRFHDNGNWYISSYNVGGGSGSGSNLQSGSYLQGNANSTNAHVDYWMRAVNDGTTIQFQFSYGGQTWVNAGTALNISSTFGGALDQIGVGSSDGYATFFNYTD